MPQSFMHIHKKNPDTNLGQFVRSRIKQLRDQIKEAESEIVMWEHCLTRLPICDRCKGYGEIRVILAQDDSEYRACKDCGGTGKP